MTYLLEQRLDFGEWEPLSIGEVEGSPFRQPAFDDLRQTLPDGLLAGEYRCFGPLRGSARLQYFALSEDGQVAVWAQS